MSVDPAMGEYLPGRGQEPGKLPAGGVFRPVNLNVYHYGGNNPIRYMDPTGAIIIAPSDLSTNMQTYGDIGLGNSGYTMQKQGCTVICNARVLNDIVPGGVGVSDVAKLADDTSGELDRNQVLQSLTGNESLAWGDLRNTDDNPNAVADKLAELEQSDEEFFAIGRGNINWTNDEGELEKGPHEVTITGVTLDENGNVESISVTGSSQYDPDRNYTVNPEEANNNTYVLDRLLFLKKPEED